MSASMIVTVDDGEYPPDPHHFYGPNLDDALRRAQALAEVIGLNEIIEHGVIDGKVVQARWTRTAAGWTTTSERAWA